MRAVCAWCGRYLGQRAPYGDQSITHSICRDCKRIQLALLRAQRIRRTQKTRYAMRQSFGNPHLPGHVEQIKYGPRRGKYYEHTFKPGVMQRLIRGGRPVTIRPLHNAVLLYHPTRSVFEDERTPGFWRKYGHHRGGNPMARRRGGDGGDWSQYLLWAGLAYVAYTVFMKPTAVATGGADRVIPQPAGTIWYSDPLQSDPATGGTGDQSFFIGSLPPGVSPPWRLASQVEINAMNLGLSAGTLVAGGGGLIIQAANVGP